MAVYLFKMGLKLQEAHINKKSQMEIHYLQVHMEIVLGTKKELEMKWSGDKQLELVRAQYNGLLE